MTVVILEIMKTAISVPDSLFRRAEELAGQWGVSRSELYATALEEFLAERESQNLTARLDEVYVDSSLAPEFALAQSKAIGREEW